MRKKKLIIIISCVLFILFVAAVIIRIRQSAAEAGKRPPMITNVVLGKINIGAIARTETLTGDIIPVQQANIFSKVSGNIEKIYVNIGDYVKEGQTLALVDTTIYSQNAKSANASYEQAEANLANSKLIYERNKSLFEQNLISKQDADNAKTAYDVALAQKDVAFANFTNAMTQLGYCRIKAPFSGYITKRFFDAGVYVISSINSAGSTLFTLMDLEKLKMLANLPEKDIRLIPEVKEIIISPDALPGSEFQGRINKIAEAVDIATRTMQVEIYIDNPKKQLKPGMFANIKFVLEQKTDARILPNEVIMSDAKGSYVYTLNPDTTVTRHYVQTGIKEDTKVEVLSGIDDSDKIIFTGQTLVKDGSKVRIVK